MNLSTHFQNEEIWNISPNLWIETITVPRIIIRPSLSQAIYVGVDLFAPRMSLIKDPGYPQHLT